MPRPGFDDTAMGGERTSPPTTSWTELRNSLGRPSAEGRERLGLFLARYWKPIYGYIRRAWHTSNEDAKDLTQGFFARLIEGDYLAHLDRERGSFRGYLRTALRHYLSNAKRKIRARKRVGDLAPSRPPGPIPEIETLADPRAATPPDEFDREWASALVQESLEDLRATLLSAGKDLYFEAFRRSFLDETRAERPSYRELASVLGVKDSDIGNYLRYARDLLSRLLERRVRFYALSDQEAREELAFVLATRRIDEPE